MFAELLDLVLPGSCVGCKAPGAGWCPECMVAVGPQPRWVVPDPSPAGFPPTVAAGSYAGPLRAALLAHKEHGRRAARGPLACALAAAVQLATGPGPGRLLLVPIPSSRAALAERGADPLLALARATARRLGPGVSVLQVLRQGRDTRDQSGLDAAARAANLAGALTLVRDGQGLLDAAQASRRGSGPLRLILVDDIATTGSTLAEACRALTAPGGITSDGAVPTRPVAAVVAATVRHHGRPVGSGPGQP